MRRLSAGESLDGVRRRAASFIEEMVCKLASEYGLAVGSCVWNLGQGLDSPGPHRLDLFLTNTAIKIYFTDEELIHFVDGRRGHETRHRLRTILSELHNEALPIPLVLALKRLANRVCPY